MPQISSHTASPVVSETLSRRRFMGGTLAGGLTLLQAQRLFAQEPTAKRWNIILIVGDDLGCELSCYGSRLCQTPHLDKLAQESVRFDKAFVTQASCSPSRSSLFTGQYPHQNGQLGLSHQGYAMNGQYVTLPQVLREQGYRIGVVGKIHVEPLSRFPFHEWTLPNNSNTQDITQVVEQSMDFLSEWPEPSFLMINFKDPHRPYVNQVAGYPEQPVPDDVEPFPYLGIDSPSVRKAVAGHLNGVLRLDAAMGMLTQRLEAAGRLDDTVIVFVGDHGAEIDRSKCTCYEAGLRVPLMIRWPDGHGAGTVRQDLVSSVDIPITLAEAAGVAAWPAACEGVSLREPDTKRPYLFAEFNAHRPDHFFPVRSVRDDRYKLIHNLLAPGRQNPVVGYYDWEGYASSRDERFLNTPTRALYDLLASPPSIELYDLQQDPYEFVNLADAPELLAVRQRLATALEAWRHDTKDFTLTSLRDPQFPLGPNKSSGGD